MKHVRGISKVRTLRADLYSDFLNSIWTAWLAFLYGKKNETVGT